MRLKATSNRPAFSITCLNDGAPMDFTDAAVTFEYTIGVEDYTDDDPEVDLDEGTVTHLWAEGETDTPLRVYGQVRATWLDGTEIVFPPYGNEVVDID